MTAHKDLKKRIRARMARTGERYAAAREHVLREREESEDGVAVDEIVEAAVLKVNERSARVRVLGASDELTVRAPELAFVAPGQIATLRLIKRWTWRGDAYASGQLIDVKTDIARLRLTPLPLEVVGPQSFSEHELGNGEDEALAALWARHTGRPRIAVELDIIAWEGPRAAESDDFDDTPISDAAELWSDGEHEEARALVMEVLAEDLRCIDGHAHLGNWMLDRDPKRALVHYEIGIAIGELSLRAAPDDYVLPWGLLYNRPFLRCLNGQGLALWKLGRVEEAAATFERMCALDPNDDQGARFCWSAVRAGERWEDFADGDNRPRRAPHTLH